MGNGELPHWLGANHTVTIDAKEENIWCAQTCDFMIDWYVLYIVEIASVRIFFLTG